MATKSIYLVCAVTSHEGFDVVRAYAKKADAESFMGVCQAHHNKRPESPRVIEDTPENGALHEKFWAREERWRKRHPAGDSNAFHEYFVVAKTTLFCNADVQRGKP